MVELFQILDYDEGELKTFCSYQCADDYACVNDMSIKDIKPLGENEEVERCDMCRKSVQREDV